MVKLDVGASFRLESCSGATGAVVRDAKGFFLAASSHLLPQVRDVLTAEAFALLHGLQLADHLGCSRVLVNSDNSSLMEAMQAAAPTCAYSLLASHEAIIPPLCIGPKWA